MWLLMWQQNINMPFGATLNASHLFGMHLGNKAVQTAATILLTYYETSTLGVALAVIRLSRQLFKTLHVFKKDVASASADSRLHVQPWLWSMLLVLSWC